MPTIAVIENERSALALISAALKAEGYRIQEYADSASAIADFVANPPDLAILDIGLPSMDGYEVIRLLRAKSNVPVIFLSATGVEPLAQRMVETVVRKPWSRPELIQQVKALLRRRAEEDAGSRADARRPPASGVGADFIRDLHHSLQQEPVLDGFDHPGQLILMQAFGTHPEAAAQWALDLIARPSQPSTTADVLRLLCRFRPHTPLWRREIVGKGLQSSSVEIRDAAIQAVESWAEPELAAMLRSHADAAPWLAEYAANVLSDLAH